MRLDAFRHVRYFFLLKRSSVECISDFFFLSLNSCKCLQCAWTWRGVQRQREKKSSNSGKSSVFSSSVHEAYLLKMSLLYKNIARFILPSVQVARAQMKADLWLVDTGNWKTLPLALLLKKSKRITVQSPKRCWLIKEHLITNIGRFIKRICDRLHLYQNYYIKGQRKLAVGTIHTGQCKLCCI